MSQYAGDPDAYPEDYSLADDAEPPTAAEVNVGLEALGDRTECIRVNGLIKQMKQTFTTAGVWVVWTKPLKFAGTHVRLRGLRRRWRRRRPGQRRERH